MTLLSAVKSAFQGVTENIATANNKAFGDHPIAARAGLAVGTAIVAAAVIALVPEMMAAAWLAAVIGLTASFVLGGPIGATVAEVVSGSQQRNSSWSPR